MKVIRKNKVFILIVILFILVLGGIVVVTTLLPSYNTSIYGNRLNGIEEVPIDQNLQDKFVRLMKEETYVTSVTPHVSGKIFYLVIHVEPNTNRDTVKAKITTLLDELSDEQKKFYDIQILIGLKNDETSDLYPVIGYKNANNEVLVWSNN